MKILKILGEHPEWFAATDGSHGRIYPTWEIWNAPRPIYGHVQWTGEFRHGVFYAGIDPDEEYADKWRRENISLDAWKLEYVTKQEALRQIREYYEKKYPEDIGLLKDVLPEQLLEAFYEHLAITEVRDETH